MSGARGIGQDLLDIPFPEMVKSMGVGIAEAQFELDRVGLRLAQMMSGEYDVEHVDEDGEVTVETITSTVQFDGQDLSMLELGFTPTFYQFVDTIIEVKMSISMSRERTYSRKTTKSKASAFGGTFFGLFGGGSARTSTVSAAYASKYQYSAEGASLMRTKLVPVPPPAVLEQRIRDVLERKRNEAAAAEAAAG